MENGSNSTAYTQAAWTAVAHFPVDAEKIDLVAQSENLTFRVIARGAETDFVLRLHRPGYSSLAELQSERQWVRALQESGIAVQVPVETRLGQQYALVDMPDSEEQRYVGMTCWREGQPLREFLDSCTDEDERSRVFGQFGQIAAQFHDLSSRWQAPRDFVRRKLDVDGLLGESPFWGRFWEHPELTDAEQHCLRRAREGLRTSLVEYGEASDKFGVIHADLTPDNVIYDGRDLVVIDFDDLAYGWHLYDIASALVECVFDRDFEGLRTAFLDGYCEQGALTPIDLKVLPDFLLVRGMAVIGWYMQRPEHAGADYFAIFRNWVLSECKRRGF